MDHVTILSIAPGSATVDRTGRHVVNMVHVHLVFVTKYRRDVLSEPAIGHLRRIFAKLCRDFEAELIACDGEDDHLHSGAIPCEDRPVEAGEQPQRRIQPTSARRPPGNHRRYHNGVLWSPSCFAGKLWRRTAR
jgi:putative transposase